MDLRCNTEIGKDITYDELKQEYDAVYIAIGAHTDKKFEVEGADSKGIISAVDMLRNIGYGKYPDFRGKRVVVVSKGMPRWTVPEPQCGAMQKKSALYTADGKKI